MWKLFHFSVLFTILFYFVPFPFILGVKIAGTQTADKLQWAEAFQYFENMNVFVHRMFLPLATAAYIPQPHLILQILHPSSAMETRRQRDTATLGWVSQGPSIFMITKRDTALSGDKLMGLHPKVSCSSIAWWMAFSAYIKYCKKEKNSGHSIAVKIKIHPNPQALRVNHQLFFCEYDFTV